MTFSVVPAEHGGLVGGGARRRFGRLIDARCPARPKKIISSAPDSVPVNLWREFKCWSMTNRARTHSLLCAFAASGSLTVPYRVAQLGRPICQIVSQ